jgi:hypothetical protein
MFRLYDWDRTDPNAGKLRDPQVEKSIACKDFEDRNRGRDPRK